MFVRCSWSCSFFLVVGCCFGVLLFLLILFSLSLSQFLAFCSCSLCSCSYWICSCSWYWPLLLMCHLIFEIVFLFVSCSWCFLSFLWFILVCSLCFSSAWSLCFVFVLYMMFALSFCCLFSVLVIDFVNVLNYSILLFLFFVFDPWSRLFVIVLVLSPNVALWYCSLFYIIVCWSFVFLFWILEPVMFHSYDIARCLCLCSLFFFLVFVVLAFLALGCCVGGLLCPLNFCSLSLLLFRGLVRVLCSSF